MNKLIAPRINVLESASMIFTLRGIAKDFSKQDGFDKALASVMIYASFIEFIMEDIDFRISEKVAFASTFLYKKEISYRTKNSGNKIRDKLEKIKQYTFPFSDELISLFGTLKADRDNLFHNLITAHERGIDVDSYIKRIQSNSEKVIELWGKLIISLDKITVQKI